MFYYLSEENEYLKVFPNMKLQLYYQAKHYVETLNNNQHCHQIKKNKYTVNESFFP